MRDGTSMWQELCHWRREQSDALDEMAKAGRELSRAEATYYRTKNLAVLRMRADGMPATIIAAAVKGDETVVDALMEHVRAQTMYDVARERLNVAKKNVTVLDNQIGREQANAS